MPERDYQICTRCVMDVSDPEIRFDDEGICNHCHNFDERVASEMYDEATRAERLEALVEDIKREGRGKDYDCVVGVSGGVDSTMVAYLARKWGLRPLAVHMDNGWNSELAVANVQRALDKLDIDLITLVVDWAEFQDLHLSFLRASVSNSEVPTDHAILAILCRTASERGIKYILSGSNIATEGVFPESWHRKYEAHDWKYIRSVHRRFGSGVKLRTFPHFRPIQFINWIFLKGIKFVPVLNYTNYVKSDAIRVLEEELGWRNYGGKHYESIYTRFFQAYILPTKFKIDKRRAHLSTLVCSGQMSRDEAVEQLRVEPIDAAGMEEDGEYVIKKLGITAEDFAGIMATPIRGPEDFAASEWVFYRMPFLVDFVKRMATGREGEAGN